MAENNAMNVRIVDGDDCCPQAMCVKVCNLVQEVRKTGASKKLIPSEKAVSDALKGRQELLVAGAAEGILGPSAATGLAQVLTAPSAGVSIVDAIKGRTLKWNALVNPSQGSHTGATVAADGLISINKTVAAGEREFLSFGDFPVVNGHIYIMLQTLVSGTATDTRLYFLSSAQSILNGAGGRIDTSTLSAASRYATILLDNQNGADAVTFTFSTYLQIIDLTDLLVAGNEPSTVAEFTALFPNFPYAYNAGTLLPFKGTTLKVTGFNQWDEQWLAGYYTQDGTYIQGNGRICSKNWVPIFPSTNYFSKSPVALTFFFYDAGKNFIEGSAVSVPANTEFTTPANARWCLWYCTTTDYGSVYLNNICIATLNGTYKPYTETVLNIDAIGKSAKDGDGNAIVPFPTGVNGDGTNNDEYNQLGGTLRWGVRAYEAGDESDATVITDGTNTVYPLDADVPFTWDEPFTLAFTAEEGGTIWLQPEGVDEAGVPVSAPLNADIAYTVPAGQVITATTLDNLLTALKTAGVITAYTMTPDGSGNYTFTITA